MSSSSDQALSPADDAGVATGVDDGGVETLRDAESLPSQSPGTAAATPTVPEHQQNQRDPLDHDHDHGLESERQRRLGSFELLDAAMDNVVEHDPSDDGSSHAVPNMNHTQSRVDGEHSDPHLAASSPMADIGRNTVDTPSLDAHIIPHVHTAASADATAPLHVAAAVSATTVATGLSLPDQKAAASESQHTDADTVSTPGIPVDLAPTSSALSVVDTMVPQTELSLAPAPAALTESTAAAADTGVEPSLTNRFEKYEPELLQWLQACQTADHGLPASQDDVLFFIESKFPELLESVAALFEWLTHFLLVYNHVDAPNALLDAADATGLKPFDRFSDDFKRSAVERLEHSGDLTSVAHEFGLKSTTTLVYWKYQRDEFNQLLASTRTNGTNSATGISSDSGSHMVGEHGRRAGFAHEQELLAWVLSHRETPITKQDIFSHVVASYPAYAATRTPAALKMWIARFLKRHLSPSMASSKDLLTALPVGGVDAIGSETASSAVEQTPAVATTLAAAVPLPAALPALAGAARPPRPVTIVSALPPPMTATTAVAGSTQPKRREKRGCPDGYVLHSNEFKLNALRKLDEGKTMSEVTEELGLKSQNTLAYWNSIRDKLAVSEKKRFRLAGGGRRSSCTFEDELLTWVAERHQRGQGTDVKAVLDYMRETHPSFTDGKKEPTLRKWILRFFKRCWRTPSVTTGSNNASSSDVEKSFIFV